MQVASSNARSHRMIAVVAVAVHGCAAPPATVATLDQEGIAACFALGQSPAHLWPKTMPPVLDLGPAAAEELERLLREAPHAPGAAAVAAALGAIGRRDSAVVLLAAVQGAPESVAAEAALALGRLGAIGAAPTLRAVMADPRHTPFVRTAAASALLRLAGRDPPALAFLCDLLLAATPEGRARGIALGLPVDRPRWALERNLAIEALSEAAEGHPLPLDADSSWPRLTDGVRAARVHFGIAPP